MSEHDTRSHSKHVHLHKEEKEEKPDMEEGHHHKKQKQESEILEKGLIYFFYRPKVGIDEVKDINDVQRFYLLLWPQAPVIHKGEKVKSEKATKRLIIIQKKALPDLKSHARYWGFVDKVGTEMDDVVHALDPKDYHTKTKGDRHVGGARPAGEGVYAIVHHGEHSHLAYVLEQPQKLGEVQKAFHIEKEGSYVLSVKNPLTKGSFLGEERRPKYPPELQEIFHGKVKSSVKFHPVNPVQLLDYEGVEISLIGAEKDIVREFGKVGEDLEEMELRDAKRLTDDKLFQELHMDKKEHPPEPLLKAEFA